MNGNDIKNIRFKLLVPFIISLVVILISNQTIMYFFQKDHMSEFTNTTTEQLKNNFNKAITEDIELFDTSLYFISQNRTLQKHWLNQDYEGLLLESQVIYNKLSKEHQVTHFYFHKPNSENYLRVHKPSHNGDTITRASLSKAIETRNISAEIEFGTLGQFVLRVVIPWKINNEIVGYIELGEEIDHILKRISKDNHYGLILAINKKSLAENKLENNKYFLNNQNKLSEHKNIVIINKTTDVLNPEIVTLIESNQLTHKILHSDNSTSTLVAKINIDRSKFATLTYIMDVSQHIKHNKDSLLKINLVSLVLGLIVLLFYFFYSKRIQRLLINNKNELVKIIKQRDHSLDESNKRYQTLFDKTADALLIIENNEFVDCNQATLDMLGYKTKQELYNTHPSRLSPQFQSDGEASNVKADKMIALAFEKGSHRFEWEHVRKNGNIFPVEVLLTAIPLKDADLLHVVWRDITQRRKAAAALEHQAYYDVLTKLPNRRLLLDRLKQALISSRRHNHYGAVLFVDIDRFKNFNDVLGHTCGDLILIESAQRIVSSIRDEDTVSRFGGDEFIILIRHVGENKERSGLNAKRVATTIQKAFAKPFKIKSHEITVTTSIGIALFPFSKHNVEDVIKNADTAMYNSKENGRNQISFYMAQMHKQVKKRITMEKDLRDAIVNKQLDVFYQPQLDNNGKVIAVEALIRWKHPEFGYVDPEYFIAISEDTGLIYDIGNFVLKKSIQDIQQINAKLNLSINVSINISTYQFRKDSFVNIIQDLIKKYDLEDNFLTLEATEHIAIDNLDEAVEMFEELRCLGVRLSLDDFGTGYSSLNYLKSLPLNEIKIDKSFVFDIEGDPQVAILVKTIIQISHQFGLVVVAEGVETSKQLKFLIEEGCDIYQGYHFCRPLPLNKLHAYLRNL